jgi:hypothetical protein
MTMKSMLVLMVAALGAALLAPVTWADETGTGAKVAKQAGDAWSTIRGYSVDKKNEAAAYGRKLLDQSDAEIARLEADSAKASGAAKAEFSRQMANLKAARAEAAARLARMEKASGNAWTQAKDGFADAYRDLRNSYDKAVGHDK